MSKIDMTNITKKIDVPTVEEAERVINHLLSYPDDCESSLDAVRYIMQWMDFGSPTEAALARHARILRQPLPEGIREDIDHVPSKRHRTAIIVRGVLEGYLKWLRANHPETGDDVDPDAEIPQEEVDLHTRRQMLEVNGFAEHPTLDELVRSHLVVTDYLCQGGKFTQREALRKLHFLFTHAQKAVPTDEPHRSHFLLVHDNLGSGEQMEVCGYCGKTDPKELSQPCPEAERMNREEDAYRENPCANIFADVRSVKLAKACISMTEDYQSSPSHHPDHILVNLKDFNDLLEAMGKPPVNMQEGHTDG